MKNILIAIRPKWVEKIASGQKTIEVRKTAPKEPPFKAYIYATKPKKFYKCGAVSTSDELLWLANGKVEMGDGFKFWADGDEYQCLNGRIIGEFICDKIDKYTFSHYEAEYRVTHVEQNAMCLNQPELIHYGKGKTLYGWHISDLKLYDSPKKLSEFRKPVDSVHCLYYGDYCEEGCVGFGSTDYFCKEYWDWEKGLIRPPQSWQYIGEVKQTI